MNMRTIAGVSVLAAVLTGCDKAPFNKIPFLGKKEAPVPVQAPAPVAADTAPVVAPAVAEPEPAPEPVAVQPVRTLVDEDWFPTDTGTVTPGMTREEVIAVWGVPVIERQQGEWTYLHFRNGCEITCGKHDVVFLQNGQVVDAVVRGRGHTYAGNSSSPEERQPEATPPAIPTSGAD
jgi:hypothetical protein